MASQSDPSIMPTHTVLYVDAAAQKPLAEAIGAARAAGIAVTCVRAPQQAAYLSVDYMSSPAMRALAEQNGVDLLAMDSGLITVGPTQIPVAVPAIQAMKTRIDTALRAQLQEQGITTPIPIGGEIPPAGGTSQCLPKNPATPKPPVFER